MERTITEVKESDNSKNTKTKKKVDLKKVAKVISENKETIAVVATTLGTLINSSNSKKTTTSKKKSTTTKKASSTKKKTTTKKKNSSSNDTVSTLVDMFLK